MAAITKTEDGVEYPASAYAYVPDPKTPSTWKLRLWESPEAKVTAKQVGMAMAALSPGGFRGEKAEVPAKDMAAVKRKVAAAWKQCHPDAKPEDMPDMLRVSEAMSFEDLQSKIREALCEKMQAAGQGPGMSDPGDPIYIVATFPDQVIVQHDAKLWRMPYTVDDQQNIALGDPELVSVSYDPVGEAIEWGARKDPTGAAWDVRILKFGRSANGWLWTRESADSLLPHLPGAPIGLYVYSRGLEAHADPEAFLAAGGPLVRNIVGDVQNPRIEADGVYGEAHIHEDASWLRTKLLTLEKRGLLGRAIGLSVDTLCGWVPVHVTEGAAKWIKQVKRLISLDVVTAPSADGRFIRATAGPSFFKEEDTMRERLLALIREHRPKLLEGRVVESLTDKELEELVREALKPQTAPATATPEEPEWARKLREDLARRDTQSRVSEALASSKLPPAAQEKVRKRFDGRVAEATEITAIIEEERAYLARISESGNVRGFGTGRAEVGAESVDKIQVALDRLLGVKAETATGMPPGLDRVHEAFTRDTAERVREAMAPAIKMHKEVGAGPRFRSIREAYAQITGDTDVSGVVDGARVSEAITSASWPNILGNTLYRALLQAYAEQDYGERNIIVVGQAVDFRTKDAVRLKYFGDLDTVDPEAADYAEIAAVGDEKVSYAVGQKGNLLTITRKQIINDDLRTISRLPGLLGRSARRTFARYVWNFAIANSAYDVDGKAWFHADHANLLAVALASANIQTAITDLANMTEPGSAETLGLNFSRGIANMGLWLAVPTALWATAKEENEREYLAADFTPNPVRGIFGQNSERIMVNPLFTDVNDWYVFRDPSDVESILIDFLQGREEPELFLADQPTVGQTFVADKIQYKIRHEYGGDIVDFRGAVKSVV